MSLSPGTRLGPYEIQALLGAGGMGEVYRARDSKLGRDVAIKVLPEAFTHDPERLGRFRREAQVLASLNHPNIGGIYGFDEALGHHFLVLEFAEGETLAGRIARGPLPVNEAIVIGRQIAEALQAAHDKGIVHRDLKPANIALTALDQVKVLDFGLAKPGDPAAGASAADVMNSPTLTSPTMLTGVGLILGTAAYMSPEQAKGRAADRRSDVWAFGCVLYEMLTGRRAFEGEDVSDTLASVLRTDPAWNTLPASLPPTMRALLEGCLKKDRHERIADISTCVFLLKQPGATTLAAPPGSPVRGRWLTGGLLALTGVALGVATILALLPRERQPTQQVTRFSIVLQDPLQLSPARRAVAISPDGTRIAYSADGRLYLREISDLEPRPIIGGDPGIMPTFSPDGQSLAYWSEQGIKRISVTGGIPLTICETAPTPYSISWQKNEIFYAQAERNLMRVSAEGGRPSVLVRLPANEGIAHGVHLLPDGDTVLFTLAGAGSPTPTRWDRAKIVAQSLSTGQRRVIVDGGSNGRYVPTGHIVYMLQGTLLAVPFDLRKLQVTGGPVPVVEGVLRSSYVGGGEAHLDISDSGTLVYVPGPAQSGQDNLVLYDRRGAAEPLKLPRGAYSYPRVSPDGKWLAMEISAGNETAVGLYELSGASSVRRLTFSGNNRYPIWSRDGKHVAFQSDREGDRGIFWQPVSGGLVERLTRAEAGSAHVPETWSPKHDVFLYSVTTGSGTTLWTFSLSDRKAARFSDVTSAAVPTDAMFSPDGRWVVYQAADGPGEATTYVQPFPPTGEKFEIARGGRPLWSRDGKELFFVPAPSQFMAVSVRTTPTFAVTPPVVVPRRFGLAPPASPRPYDMLPDGRIVATGATDPQGESLVRRVHVTVNWFEQLRTKVPIQ